MQGRPPQENSTLSLKLQITTDLPPKGVKYTSQGRNTKNLYFTFQRRKKEIEHHQYSVCRLTNVHLYDTQTLGVPTLFTRRKWDQNKLRDLWSPGGTALWVLYLHSVEIQFVTKSVSSSICCSLAHAVGAIPRMRWDSAWPRLCWCCSGPLASEAAAQRW